MLSVTVACHREWQDLGRPAQCFVGAGILLAALLLVQDLQEEDGIHRGIVLPILLVIVDIIKLLFTTAAFILYRPLNCLATCSLEVVLAAADVSYVLASALLWVIYDIACIPWLLVCMAARLLLVVLSWVVSLMRICLFCVVVIFALGVPTFLGAPNDQPLRDQLSDLLQVAVEWLRQQLQQHSQQAAQHGQRPLQQAAQHGQRPLHQAAQPEQRPLQQAAQPRQRPLQQAAQLEHRRLPHMQQAAQHGQRMPRGGQHYNILRNFFRLLFEEQRTSGGEAEEAVAGLEGGGGREGRQQEGEWEDARWGEEEEEEVEDTWQNEVNPESFLHVGDTFEVW